MLTSTLTADEIDTDEMKQSNVRHSASSKQPGRLEGVNIGHSSILKCFILVASDLLVKRFPLHDSYKLVKGSKGSLVPRDFKKSPAVTKGSVLLGYMRLIKQIDSIFRGSVH